YPSMNRTYLRYRRILHPAQFLAQTRSFARTHELRASYRSRNSYTWRESTPGNTPVGSAASRLVGVAASGHALPSHFTLRPSGAVRQQDSSGHHDCVRCVVSLPRNHFTSSKGTPTLTE